jgi:hypothetical protein
MKAGMILFIFSYDGSTIDVSGLEMSRARHRQSPFSIASIAS